MKSAIVIGSGVIGLCAAREAQRRGWKVTVIDRSPRNHPGCSHGNAGMVVPSHFIPMAAPGMVGLGLKWMANPESPFFIKPRFDAGLVDWLWKFMRAANNGHVSRCAPVLRDLNLASRALYADWSRSFGNPFGLEEKGLLMLCKTTHTLEEEAAVAARARELGIPADVLDARQLAKLEPDVRLDVEGAVHYPMDCHLDPGRLVTWLRDDFEQAGGILHTDTSVEAWTTRNGTVESVTAGGRKFSADAFVLAAGSWSPECARDLGLRLPMQAGKGYSFMVDSPRECPARCAILTEARVAVTPLGGALRFGGTMEIAGMDESINQRRVKGIARSVPAYFPAFSAEDLNGREAWGGLRPCAPDGMPYLGKAMSNLVVATGHAMMGLSLGPVTGRIVGSLLDGEDPGFDLAPLAVDRFAR